jgi:hypothetical protein
MLRRIAPLLLALAVAGAPVALELCQIACASLAPQPDAATAAHGHSSHSASCHDTAESPAPLSFHAQPCGHGDDLSPTPAIGSARHSAAGASAAAAVPATGSIAGAALRTQTSGRFEASDSSVSRVDLILPLRI